MYTLPPDTVAGSISFSQYLDISKDVVVSFDYACYGPGAYGNEGFCVFFCDTVNPIINGGGPGPGLAYATVSGINTGQIAPTPPDLYGITSGLLGVGFDLTGNFGNNSYFGSGYDDAVENTIALRSSYGSDFNIITRTPNLNGRSFTTNTKLYQQITGDDIPVYKRVRVRLTDFGTRIVVDIKSINELYFTNYLNYSFTTYNTSILSSTNIITSYNTALSDNPVKFTPTIRCGLGFSTGGDTGTTFKIKNFNVNGLFSLSASQADFKYTYLVDTATLSATVAYSNPSAPFFYRGDQLKIVNVLGGGSPELIDATAQGVNTGAPYTGDGKYVIVDPSYPPNA